jgi:hypothetical protein
MKKICQQNKRIPACRRRAQPRRMRELGSLFDQAYGLPRTVQFLQNHTGIHPLIPQPVGHVMQDAILEHNFRFFIRRPW